MVQDNPCVRVLQRNKPAGCVCVCLCVCVCVCVCVCIVTKRGRFKESVHEVVDTGKSEACRGVWEAGNSHTS